MLRDISFLLVSLVTLATFFTRSGAQMTLLPLLATQRARAFGDRHRDWCSR